MATEEQPAFGRAVRTAGVLTAGRQIGAGVLTVGVLLLPRYVPRAELDRFLWAYFAQLLLSSILNLGLERYTAREVAGRDAGARTSVLGAALVGRIATAPLTALGLAALLAIVGVELPAGAWVATTVWTWAVQLQGVLFAAIRAVGLATSEAAVALGGRLVQTALLLGAAMAGWGLVGLLWTVAAVDVVVTSAAAITALRSVGIGRAEPLPYRRLGLYTAHEMSAFAYLRVDLVVVGAILGEATGATYGLGYRVVDALVSLSIPGLLVLFAYASGQAARGVDMEGLRRRTQALLPHLGVLLAAIAIVGVAPLVDALPRLESAAPALRVLLASIPLTYLIGVEAQLLSAEDRNVPLLVVAGSALGFSVVLNVILVDSYGMVGAAAALVITEVWQVAGLAIGANATGTRTGAVRVLVPAALLLVGAVALNRDVPAVGAMLLVAAAVVAAIRFRTGIASGLVEGRE